MQDRYLRIGMLEVEVHQSQSKLPVRERSRLDVWLGLQAKNESLMDVPPLVAAADPIDPGLLPRPPYPPEPPGTELLTAAKTTLANDIPLVDPRKRGSEAPCTETMPMLETNLCSLSDSSCFCSHSEPESLPVFALSRLTI